MYHSLGFGMYGLLSTIILLNTSTAHALRHRCEHLDYQREQSRDLCSENHICNRTFTVTYIDVPPYVHIFKFEDSVLARCCGKCVNVIQKPHIRHAHEVKGLLDPESEHSSDFIFPVLDKSTSKQCHGYHFIPVVRLPSLIYVSRFGKSPFERAVVSCINLYPMLTICLLMSLIAGFIIWKMEMNENEKYFPNEFPMGWLNGIWWSLVSLASTGLERNPKSFPGRLLSVVWIVVAVIMLGLLTSSITAAMLKPISTPKMEGAKVGTLQYKPYNDYIITKYGGHIKKFPRTNVYKEFYTMVESFYKKDIDGVLMDKYTLSFASKETSHFTEGIDVHISPSSVSAREKIVGNEDEIAEVLTHFTTRTRLTEKGDDENMSFGLLVRDRAVYDFLEDAMRENWLDYETTFASYVNNVTKKETQRRAFVRLSSAPLFSPSDPYVYYAMGSFGSIILVLTIYGLLFERKRKKMLERDKNSNSEYQLDENFIEIVNKS